MELLLKMKLLKLYLHQNQCCITSIYFSPNSEQIKSSNKNFYQKIDYSIGVLQAHVDKPSNDYDVNKVMTEKNNPVIN